MAPPRTGIIEPHGDHFDARVRFPDGKKGPRICLDRSLDRDAAKIEAGELQRVSDEEHAKARAAVPPPRPTSMTASAKPLPPFLKRVTGPGRPKGPPRRDTCDTCDTWADRWFEDRELRGLSSAVDDRGRWRNWISPSLGSLPMRDGAITKGHIEDLVEHLDRSVFAGDISWKTASNIWVLASKAFKDAVNSKTRSLRVLTVNPALGVRGPEQGAEKALQYLTPAEFLRLVSCTALPLHFRRACVLAVYLLVRASELVPLACDAIDLEAGVVTVHTALDKQRKAKSTKTKRTRRVPIEPPLRPLLTQMYREVNGKGRIVPLGVGLHLARDLRKYLLVAGITRSELHTSDATRRAIRFHDLRATGITWHAINGLDALKIMARSGHETYSTMQGYVREAEVLAAAGTFGQVFPPLPLEALGVPLKPPQAPIVAAPPEQQPAPSVALLTQPHASDHPQHAPITPMEKQTAETPSSDRPNDCPSRAFHCPKSGRTSRNYSQKSERETGFEPATLSLGSKIVFRKHLESQVKFLAPSVMATT